MQGALARDLPVLGICRGHQMIACVVGGPCLVPVDQVQSTALRHHVEDPPLGRRSVHPIRIEAGTRLHALVGANHIGVNSLHRQAVGQVAPPLIVSARADDGVVEALESSVHRFVLGVQFHPELLLEEAAAWGRLFDAFVAACRESRRRWAGKDWRRSRQSPGATRAYPPGRRTK
ncbi:MAG TPA: gamma-glutamyl-gamma-aminobutyrate hydrolase family protein [Limnochordales bacterium]